MKGVRTSLIAIICLAIISVAASNAFALKVGDTLQNVEVKDSKDKPATIPDFGKKIITIFYNDADVADQNDPAAEAMKAKKFPEAKYRGIGIGNLKDAPWKPNSIIRMIARKKEKKFNSTILTDPKYILRDAWKLGDCNEKSVCIIIDRSGKVIYYYKGKMNKAETDKAIKAIEAAL
jgi:predicted transcriptional regulator